MPQVVGVSCVKEAWEKLANSYATGSKSQVRNIKANFYCLKKEKNESIAQYTQRAKGMFDQLAAINSPVT